MKFPDLFAPFRIFFDLLGNMLSAIPQAGQQSNYRKVARTFRRIGRQQRVRIGLERVEIHDLGLLKKTLIGILRDDRVEQLIKNIAEELASLVEVVESKERKELSVSKDAEISSRQAQKSAVSGDSSKFSESRQRLMQDIQYERAHLIEITDEETELRQGVLELIKVLRQSGYQIHVRRIIDCMRETKRANDGERNAARAPT